jgi:hypothetical protein
MTARMERPRAFEDRNLLGGKKLRIGRVVAVGRAAPSPVDDLIGQTLLERQRLAAETEDAGWAGTLMQST